MARLVVDTNNPYTLFVTPYYHFHLIKAHPDDDKFVDCAVACNAKYATEMSTQTLSYRFATELETNIFAKILDCLKQGVFATFNSDARDVKRGERSIRTYKKGMPIPLHGTTA